MGQFFHFTRLIQKYGSSLTVEIKKESYIDDLGDYVHGEPIIQEIFGAVLSVSERRIYQSDGAITTKDRQLFLTKPLESDLFGAKALYKGNHYSIEEDTENGDFTGVYPYLLKFVSAFDKKGVVKTD